jgi:hypothetical protein
VVRALTENPSGSAVIIATITTVTPGTKVTMSARPMNINAGSSTAGNTAVAVGCWSKVTGAKLHPEQTKRGTSLALFVYSAFNEAILYVTHLSSLHKSIKICVDISASGRTQWVKGMDFSPYINSPK